MDIILEGVVESVVYYNANNGYTVFEVSVDDTNVQQRLDTKGVFEDDDVTCVGYTGELIVGEALRMAGSFVMHPTYGKQFSVGQYEKIIPTTALGIEKYLSSGIVKGIGEKLAKNIVKKFGNDTFTVIESYPEKLTEIKGISLDKARIISATIHEQAEKRRVMLFLHENGISPAYSQKIYNKYKDAAINVIKKNPYILADDIFGIGFRIADDIAQKIGIREDSEYRIKAGIRYILSQAANDGHVYLPRDVLCGQAAELLDISGEIIDESLSQLQYEKHLIQDSINDHIAVYSSVYYHAEAYIARKLLELSENVKKRQSDIRRLIEASEHERNLTLAENQKHAVEEALTHGVLVITGGPGTGKTTTIKTIISILKKDGCDIELAAPTGRAAKRMTEATGIEAKTIHRLLGISFMGDDSRRQFFDRNEENPLEADLIIIDESSMIDTMLMMHLLKAIAPGTRLILVGDVDQLPSVGAGKVLKDIIKSECITVVRLEEIFRQAQESAIVMNAHRINHGEEPVLNEKNKDFFFIKKSQVEETVSTVLDLAVNRLPKYMNCEPREIQVITPMRKSPLGVQSLNLILQQAINPPSPRKAEKEYRSVIFRENDKVMHIKNNYNIAWAIIESGKRIDEGLGVFNGDTGIIKRIDSENERVTVLFDDYREVVYEYSQLDELELAYAITVHKSQGSEYRTVVMPLLTGPYVLMSRNLLYTGITRAKELAVIVGLPNTLYSMVANNREINRYTGLEQKLRKTLAFMSTAQN